MIGADSLGYLSIEGLFRSIQMPEIFYAVRVLAETIRWRSRKAVNMF